jgi:hypothetical protein
MKRIAWVALLAAAAWFPSVGRPAWGEEPSALLRLELTLSRAPIIAHPLPDITMARRDAEEAVARIRAREREEEMVLSTIPGPPRRPDLSYDVVNGIQARRLNDALSRR